MPSSEVGLATSSGWTQAGCARQLMHAVHSLNRSAARDSQQACNAQHIRNYTIDASYDQLNWTQLLMPLFFLSS